MNKINCSVVRWYSSRYLCIFCQTAEGWTDCGWGGCRLLVSLGYTLITRCRVLLACAGHKPCHLFIFSGQDALNCFSKCLPVPIRSGALSVCLLWFLRKTYSLCRYCVTDSDTTSDNHSCMDIHNCHNSRRFTNIKLFWVVFSMINYFTILFCSIVNMCYSIYQH